MNSEVIVIEDSPPTSPLQTANQNYKRTTSHNQKNMYYQPLHHEFPVAEQAMTWSRNTTNFIKQSMTVVQQNNRIIQKNSVPYMYPGTNRFLTRNGFQFSGVRGMPGAPFINYNPCLNYPYYQQNYINNSTYFNDFWMKVKLEETPERGEIVSQYYFDNNSQTPIRINNNFIQNSQDNGQLLPEYIDVNTFANKFAQKNIDNSNTTRFSEQTNESSLNLSEDKKKNPVPLFLKRSRVPNNNNANNKSKISENNKVTKDVNNSAISEKNIDDVIFVSEFKVKENLPEIVKTEPTEEFDSSNDNSAKFSQPSQNNDKDDNDSFNKIGKRKRKERTLIQPRRNPKRQVQIEKDFLKMIDEAILESDKEEKTKKLPYVKPNKTQKVIKPCRRSTRITATDGAVYSPPSPLTTDHIRDWPVEGMHERPEYNPDTGKIEPFDEIIRNISKDFNTKQQVNNNEKEFSLMKEFKVDDYENEKSFPELCHEMLHHVLAYVATVKSLQKKDILKSSENTEKLQFLQNLSLTDNSEISVCEILKTTVSDITLNAPKQSNSELVELLKNSVVLYCLTNNVEMSDVAKYIENLNSEDIIKLSNEQFKLSGL